MLITLLWTSASQAVSCVNLGGLRNILVGSRRKYDNGYWLLLRGGIVQSVPCNCDYFLIYSAHHLIYNHCPFILQSSLL
jgi:hypothetical protein